MDRGFVLSDHADWPGLQQAIAATGAERIIVTHGYEAVMVRWLTDQPAALFGLGIPPAQFDALAAIPLDADEPARVLDHRDDGERRGGINPMRAPRAIRRQARPPEGEKSPVRQTACPRFSRSGG